MTELQRQCESDYERLIRIATAWLSDSDAAQDCAQEAICQALEYEQRRGEPVTSARLVLNRIFYRVTRRYERQGARTLHIKIFDMDEFQTNGHGPDLKTALNESWERISAAMLQIPVRQHKALLAIYESGLNHTEAAKEMKMTKNALDMLVKHGLENLRAVLSDPDAVAI